MSKTRLSWVMAQVQGFKPSSSMILRRALAVYQHHLETVLADPDRISGEMTALKSCASGDLPPWKNDPDFTKEPGKPLSEYVRHAHQKQVRGFMNHSPFERMARRTGAVL